MDIGINICSIHHPIEDFDWLFNDPLMTTFDFFRKKHRKTSKICFRLIVLPPGRRVFADARVGDGGGPFGAI